MSFFLCFSFVAVWSVTSAPLNSVYAPQNSTATYASTTTVTGAPVVGAVNTTTSVTTTYYTNTTLWSRMVTLTPPQTPSGSNPSRVWPVCLRPDIGGQYAVQLTVYPVGAADCVQTAAAAVYTNCSAPPVIQLTPDSANTTVFISRSQPTHITLNASASFDPEGLPLTFWWQQIAGPTVSVLHHANTSVASFVAVQSDLTYGFMLTVTHSFSGFPAPPALPTLIVQSVCRCLMAAPTPQPTPICVPPAHGPSPSLTTHSLHVRALHHYLSLSPVFARF